LQVMSNLSSPTMVDWRPLPGGGIVVMLAFQPPGMLKK
jgi:hypothetical protein